MPSRKPQATRSISLMFISVLLTCCVSAADQEVQRIQTLTRTAIMDDIACAAAISAKPQYAHLYQKFNIGREANGTLRQPTPTQLADRERVSDEDIGNVLEYHAEAQACRVRTMDTLGKIDPELAIIMAHQEQDIAGIFSQMVQYRPPYGTINLKIVDLKERTKQESAQWGQKLRSRIAVMRQQDQIQHAKFLAQVGAVTEAVATLTVNVAIGMAHQQALAAQAQANYAATHPTYVVEHRISTTNCQWLGTIWTCTSN